MTSINDSNGWTSATDAGQASNVLNRADLERHGSRVGRLLDREIPTEYLREWTERVAAEKTETENDTQSVLVFRIGEEWLSLPTRIVHEVAEQLTLHIVPHRRDGALMGLVSFRGELWLCVSLQSVLGIEGGRRSAKQKVYDRVVLTGKGNDQLAIPVDEVLGVRRFQPQELVETPATLTGATAKYSVGLLMEDEKAIGCLDEELLFYSINKSLS